MKTRQLTPRQHQVLRMVLRGWPNKTIAERLDISPRTVEVHRYTLMKRLQVRNGVQLFRAALNLGLVKPPAPRRVA